MATVRKKLDVTLCKVAAATTTVRVVVMADVNMTAHAMRNIAGTKASAHLMDNPDDVEWGDWEEIDIGETDMSRVQNVTLAHPPRAPAVAYRRTLELCIVLATAKEWAGLEPRSQVTLRESWVWLHSELPNLTVDEVTSFDRLTRQLQDMNAPAFAVEVLA